MKKDTREKRRRIDVEFDGMDFVYVNPEFASEERDRMAGMTLEEKIDYILFGSTWAIAFKNEGWKKAKREKTTVYEQRNEKSGYSRLLKCSIRETEVLTFVIKENTPPVYTRHVTGMLLYDDGTCEPEDPIIETNYGEKALNIMTEGIWYVIFRKD